MTDISMHQTHQVTIVSDMTFGEIVEHLRSKGVQVNSSLPGVNDAVVLVIERDQPVQSSIDHDEQEQIYGGGQR